MKTIKYLTPICLLIISFSCKKKNPCDPPRPCPQPIPRGEVNFKIIDKDSSDLIFDKKLITTTDSIFLKKRDKSTFFLISRPNTVKNQQVISVGTWGLDTKNAYLNLGEKKLKVFFQFGNEPPSPGDCCTSRLVPYQISVDNQKICTECYKQEIIYIVIPDECIPNKKGS